MLDHSDMICVKQSDQHISQGKWLWGPDANGVACLELESGETVVGDYIPSLFDAAKSEDSLPFE